MPNEGEKLEQFKNAVFEEADLEAKQIIEEALAAKSRILQKWNDEILSESRERFKAEMQKIQQNYSKSISHKEFEIKKETLAYRNNLLNNFFSEIAEKLKAFSQSDEYKEFIEEKLKKAEIEKPFNSETIVYVKVSDENLIKNLTKTTLIADKKIKLGGFAVSYPDSGLYIDNTLDKALEDEKTAFVRKAELRL